MRLLRTDNASAARITSRYLRPSVQNMDWQVHVYGDIEEAFAAGCRELSLPFRIFDWSEVAENAGLKRDAAYLIRPDGHVALASSAQSVAKLRAFVDRLGLRFPARLEK